MFYPCALQPDGDEALSWVSAELAKLKYRRSTSLAELLESWLASLIQRVARTFSGESGTFSAFVILLTAAVFVLFAFFAFRYGTVWKKHRKISEHAPAHPALFSDARGSGELFRAADAALENKNPDLAVIERYRGVIRYLEEQHVISVLPGITALEAARLAVRAVGREKLFAENALRFNRIFFGYRHADNDAVALSCQFMTIVTELTLKSPTLPAERIG